MGQGATDVRSKAKGQMRYPRVFGNRMIVRNAKTDALGSGACPGGDDMRSHRELWGRQWQRTTAAATIWMAIIAIPSVVYGQASITGTVKDTSDALLPGVTVEAASPALIEKVRTAVTDGTGQFRIENLRPGQYTVTFTLPGFATVRREGIEL